MNFKNFILIIAIIVVVIGAAAFLLSHQAHPKKDAKISIVSEDNLTEGDNLTVKLADLNGTPLSGQSVSLIIIADGGQSVQKNLTTDANGQAGIELDDTAVGNCAVKVKYAGNDEFNGCNFTDNIRINKKVVIIQTNQTAFSQNTTGYHGNYSDYNSYYYYDDVVTVSEDYYGNGYY